MGDPSYEASDLQWFGIGHRQRPAPRHLVDPPRSPAATDEPLPDEAADDDGDQDVSVRLDPDGMVARITIEHRTDHAPAPDDD